MSRRNRNRAKSNRIDSPTQRIVGDPHRIRLFIGITIAYVICVSLLALILGVTVATFLSTPIWAFLFLLFSRSGKPFAKGITNRVRSIQIPKPDWSTVAFVALATFLIQFALGFLCAEY